MMQFSAALVAAASLIFSTSVSGHMYMKTPAPYKVNNFPLAADGSDFPCKKTYTGATGSNTIPIGVPQILSFTGGATHGGGSCQIALTTDKAPTPATKWSVIHSIMGGCPTNTTDGNLSETDSEMADPSTFGYTIPEGIAPGDYTLGVTWFNRVGNREMYMMCAPVTITGGSAPAKKRGVEVRRASSRGAKGWFNKRANFPDLFRANIGTVGSGCGTVSGTDLIFPDPGDSVEYDRAGGSANPSLKGPSNCASPTVAAGGGGGSPATAAPPGSAGAATVASQAPTAAPSSAPAVAATSAYAASSQVVVPVPVASSAAAAAPSPTAAGSTGSTGSAGTGGGLSGACTTEGMFNCIGGSSFQQCASGAWSPVQPMAAGTNCKVGQSQGLWA